MRSFAAFVLFFRKFLRQRDPSETALAQARTERLEEERLRQREQSWKAALDGAGHGVWDWHLATDTVDYSSGWKTLLGYADDEIGHDLTEWTDRIHPEDLPPALAAVQAHLAGATPHYEAMHRLRCKDGGWKWILTRGSVFTRDASGQPERLIGTHTDITAQKATEEHLQRSEERLRLALAGARLGAYHWDRATDEMVWDDTFRAIFGLPPQAPASYATWLACLDPRDRPGVEGVELEARTTGGDSAIEYRILRPDGAERWISDLGRFYVDAQGLAQRMEGIVADITARKRAELALRRYQQTVETASDMLLFIDRDLRYQMVNPAFAAFHHSTPARLAGRRVAEVELPAIYAEIAPHLEASLAGATRHFTFHGSDLAGQERWLEVMLRPYLEQGAVAGIVASLHDLTEVRAAQAALEAERAKLEAQVQTRTAEIQAAHAALQESESRYRTIFNSVSEGILIQDPGDGRILDVNERMLQQYGGNREAVLAAGFGALLAGVPPYSLADALEHNKRVQTEGPQTFEWLVRRRDGSHFWAEISLSLCLIDGHSRLLATTRDISQRKAAEEALQQARAAAEAANRELQAANRELQRLATTDSLTGVWNRHHFEEALTAEIRRVARYRKQPLSLMLFDLDHFKEINDTHGHPVGDQVLIALTRRIQDQVRAVDVLARWGGEEFVMLLPHTRSEDAVKLAEKLRQLVAGEPFPGVGQVTISFGVAEYRPQETPAQWLKRVDDALYAAKAGGRNRVCLAEAVLTGGNGVKA